MKYVIIAAALISVAGCATGKRMLINPNATPEQALKDENECTYQAQVATATVADGFARAFRMSDLRESCMKARGYTVEYRQ